MLPQNPIAEKALSELAEMPFGMVMELSVSDEAKDVNMVLMEMSQFVMEQIRNEYTYRQCRKLEES